MQNQNQKKINIKIDEKVGEGVYSNLVVISHNQSEFIIDFARLLPGVPDAKILSRIIKTPQHAKQFMMSLKANIENYEKKFGEIASKANTDDNKSIGFTNNSK
ncbi:MAG: hypothetical protein B6226_02155 [Candidatus Cloacimonetes bacterium 4572_65]|nr:MAG: hypothetical protein B6226_02155 [Candidatus Cloacimonetes bacterium 4572_65]